MVIHTINMMIVMNTDAIYQSTEGYLQILLEIMKEDSEILKKRSIQGLTNILDFRMELALTYYEPLFEAMLEALKTRDQAVAMAAAEFWSGLAINRLPDEEEDLKRVELVKKVIEHIGPILLECCRFTEADRIASLPFNNEDAGVYDEDFYDQDEEEQAEEYAQMEGLSTLRRASAFAFERLAIVSPEATFESIKGALDQYLGDDKDWEGREAAVIALGAICEDGNLFPQIEQYLPNIIPVLFEFLS